ncbi:hypothetical protein CSA37_12405 [Candidatus Fermentibacteria bacterium]|nr:MAG: hypothetical protein CSA37_12405 [Candidatus Fermentibacteria bacterium]
MTKTVMVVLISHRKNGAAKVQAVLTGWGCLIKTRLGIHEGVQESCSENGLLFLDLVGDKDRLLELERKLNVISGVTAKLIAMELDD